VGSLDGKVAIVTGAAQGIGAAYARHLATCGATVVLADVDEQLVAQTAEKIAADGLNAWGAGVDIADPERCDALVLDVVARSERIDVLVNNAAIYRVGLIEGERLDDFNRILAVNLTGTFLGIRACIPALRDAGGGSIINISSVAGLDGFSGHAAYGSSKWAVRGLTKIAALELGEYRIRVNSIHPGAIDTPMIAGFSRPGVDRGAAYPISRIGVPLDVAHLALFLASDESTYVSGAEITVDGGLHAGARL